MKVSIVCPFYNEESIIENAIEGMLEALKTLPHEWELILVNDGSEDNSLVISEKKVAHYSNVKLVGYSMNRGRGYALRYGIEQSQGDIVITTEIDLSWGDDIVHRLVEAFHKHKDADMIVASPNLKGGGYRNVPMKRVFLSKIGNIIIKASQQSSMTMYTGMTRAYRRDAFLSLPIDENEKEFHLEVAHKAQTYGYEIYEIPCILEWKDHRLTKADAPKRKSSSKITKLVKTHMVFALAAAPFRYLFPVSLIMSTMSLLFIIMAFINLFRETPSAFYFISGLIIFLIALVVFAVGVLSYQIMQNQRDSWRIRKEILELDNKIRNCNEGK